MLNRSRTHDKWGRDKAGLERRWELSFFSTILLMAPFDLIASMGMDIYLPVVSAIPGALNAKPWMVQLSLSMYLLILGSGQLIFGKLSDVVGRRPVLLAGGLGFMLSSMGLALADSIGIFLAFRFMQGLAASAMLVAMFSSVRDVYAGRPESFSVYGILNSMLAFVPAVAPIVGALLSSHFGWRAVFWFLAAAMVPMLIHAWFRWEETRALVVRDPVSFVRILSQARFLTFTLAFGTAMGTFFVFLSTSPWVLMVSLGYTETQFSLAFSSVAVCMILSAKIFGSRTAAWGIDNSVIVGMCIILMAVGTLLVLSRLLELTFYTFVMPMWLMASGVVLVVSASANGALEGFDNQAGLAVSLYYCLQSLVGAGLGTLAVFIFGGDTLWPLIVYPACMATVVLILLAKQSRKAAC